MILNETNKGHYSRNVGDVFLDNSILLARLIVNYFAKKGFISDEKYGKWNNDLSNKNENDGSYKSERWEFDWHQNGVNFKFKQDPKKDWPDGNITIGFKQGYAIVKIHAEIEGEKRRINETYKISLNKTVLELCQSLVRKYRSHRKGLTSKEDIYQAKSDETAVVKLYKSKGFNAEFDENRGYFYIWPNDMRRVFPDKKTYSLLSRINSNHSGFNRYLALEDTQKDFITVTKYVINKYAKQGYALSDNERETSFWVNSSSGIKLRFKKGDEDAINKGKAYFNYLVDKMSESENGKTREQIANKYTHQTIINFFEDDYKQSEIIRVLEHI